MNTVPRRIISALVVAAAAALLVGCGSSGTSPSGSGGTPGAGSVSSPTTGTTAAGTAVTATETEYSITFSATTFTAGTYTFNIHNTGTMPHNLNVNGPRVAAVVSPTIDPGGTGRLTVTLQKGSYELWCSVDSHKQLGMDTKIQVS
jgi:hypothetical protein